MSFCCDGANVILQRQENIVLHSDKDHVTKLPEGQISTGIQFSLSLLVLLGLAGGQRRQRFMVIIPHGVFNVMGIRW